MPDVGARLTTAICPSSVVNRKRDISRMALGNIRLTHAG